MANIVFSQFSPNPQDLGYVLQTDTLDDGTTQQSVVPIVGATGPAANFATMIARAQTALGVNASFLANPSITNAQAINQVSVLTREINALIKYVLHPVFGIATTSGT